MTPESHLPEWQQKFNQFCENWLYAFLVAMVIRHFCLEAFQIPTASMEPMLYGDAALLKRDQVVVDKLTPRFTGVHRWDVTVFQYPRPEVEEGGDGRPALSADGHRLDVPLLRPLFCRNFVKRAVVLPGDVFYISGGNIYLRQDDGTFACATKPNNVQEAVWLPIYRHQEQEGYLPWSSGVSAQGEALRITTTASAPAVFTQPLRNLYLKPGPVRVAPLLTSESDVGATVEASLTKPVFTYGGRLGNLWDLDQWRLRRVTTRDLDSGSHGAVMNPLMNEFVTDSRWKFRLTETSGAPALRLDLGNKASCAVIFTHDTWQVTIDNQQVGTGPRASTAEVAFGRCDDVVSLRLDGIEVFRQVVPACDGSLHRPRWSWNGDGTATVTGATLERDLHYTARGFLAHEGADKAAVEAGLRAGGLDDLSRDRAADQVFRIGFLREQMRWQEKDRLTAAQRVDRWGISPETAITAPPGCYLLLGDNSPFSLDSRMWGWVPEENLRGRALAVMFPPARWRIIR
jgi:signal peptidase I